MTQVASTCKGFTLPTTSYIGPSGHVVVVDPGALTTERLVYTLGPVFSHKTPQDN